MQYFIRIAEPGVSLEAENVCGANRVKFGGGRFLDCRVSNNFAFLPITYLLTNVEI
jgi:hypothetical protein